MTKEEIATVLKNLRLSTGMTQKEVAEKLGRKQQVIGHWETGYAQPDANTLFTLCEIYNTSVDAAFGFTSPVASPTPFTLTPPEEELITDYRKLNNIGKEEAKKRVHELTMIEDYTQEGDAKKDARLSA